MPVNSLVTVHVSKDIKPETLEALGQAMLRVEEMIKNGEIDKFKTVKGEKNMTDQPTQEAQVVQIHTGEMMVCVPETWSDQQAEDFANISNPSGTIRGWKVPRKFYPELEHMLQRVYCASKSRAGFVHIMLEC